MLDYSTADSENISVSATGLSVDAGIVILLQVKRALKLIDDSQTVTNDPNLFVWVNKARPEVNPILFDESLAIKHIQLPRIPECLVCGGL